MENWMDEDKIKDVIISLRKAQLKEYIGQPKNLINDLNDPVFWEYLPFFLEEIKKIKSQGLEIFNNKKNLYETIASLLEIEANIITIINVAIYEQFSKEQTPYFYLQKNEPFIYDDYLTNVLYCPTEFGEISFLSKFCSDFLTPNRRYN